MREAAGESESFIKGSVRYGGLTETIVYDSMVYYGQRTWNALSIRSDTLLEAITFNKQSDQNYLLDNFQNERQSQPIK